MSLPAGTRLGPYVVAADLGAGGMGEVYRARDERLGRDVAVKILPAEMARDPDRVRRFEREARAVAALDHPGVVVIHDVGEAHGVAFLVTELLSGETLRERLRGGPAPAERVAEWGAAAADALAAAHARGVVHRDVKPENLFLTRDGRLKVLDFGLAKEDAAHSGGGDETPTLTAATAAGAVVGTPGYLSPEQARGGPIDARTDVFSLGCVLFEALTGRRAFGGASVSDSVAALLRDEPPEASELRPEVPAALSQVVRRCLAREREARFQSASDLAFALRLVGPAAAARRAAAPAWRSRAALAVAVALVVLAAAGLTALRLRKGSEPAVPIVRQLTSGTMQEGGPVLSPDGSYVAYLAGEGERADVWVKFVEGGAAANLTVASGLRIQSGATIGGLDISPDGKAIAVRAAAPGEPGRPGVWLIPAPLGGPPRRLVDWAGGLRWSPDGEQIAFMRPDPALGDAILVARRDGSEERVVLAARPGIHAHEPAWSADGRWVYFNRGLMPNNEAPTEIWRVPSAGGDAEAVVRTRGVAVAAQPLPGGRGLVYVSNEPGGTLNLWWRPLDGGGGRRLTLGAGEYVAPRLSRGGGRLVCEARTSIGSLRVVDLAGPVDGPGRALTPGGNEDAAPSVARTGRLAFASARAGTLDVWTSDADGGNARPLTSDPEIDSLPAISPDGTRVAFVSDRGGRRGLWLAATDGGTLRALATGNMLDRPSWSGDGRRLVYAAEGPEGQARLWVVPAEGGAAVAVPNVSGRSPAWSPVEDAIAYFTSTPEGLRLRFAGSRGESRLANLDVPTGAVSALAISWDGRALGVGISPGSGDAEIAIVDLATGQARRVLRAGPFTTLRGLAWSAGDSGLVYGLVQYQSRVLLIDGLGL